MNQTGYNEAAIYEVLALAIEHHKEERLEEAEKLYRVILKINPDHPDANYNFAVLAVDLGYIKESIPFFEKAIEVYSTSEQYYIGYIDALIKLNEFEKAKMILEEAKWISTPTTIENLKKRIPESTSASKNSQKLNLFELLKTPNQDPSEADIKQWNALFTSGNYREAEQLARKMTEKFPNSGNSWKLLGASLMEQMKYQDALDVCKKALKFLPNDPETNYNLGVTLQGLKLFPQATERYFEALKLDPSYYRAYGNLGMIFSNDGKFQQAIEYYQKTLTINPNVYQIYNNLGSAYNSQGDHPKARDYYYKALEADPTQAFVFGNILFSLNYDPDMSAEEIFSTYQEYDKRYAQPLKIFQKPHINNKNPNRKLKIGYVSPDFNHHPVRYFLEPLLANHDKSSVEIYAYSELLKEDAMTQMYKGYCDHWISTIGMSDTDLAEQIRKDEIDILVELAGHTNNNRLEVFAMKPAPVSLSWLGYGYTTGLSAIDYYLTDEISVPKGSEHLFSEKPWKIETPSYAYTPAIGMGEVNSLPALEKGYITFGTLTRAARVNHRTIRVWAELLKRVPNSKLIINSKDYRDPSMKEILIKHFQEHGIEEERLEIRYYSPPWDVLRRMDIGVDCFPHNSGTTLFETLHMGIPYVTLAGRASVGRIGSSILHGVGRQEWIAQSEEEYINKLVALSSDLPALSKLRSSLREEMIKSPLMDERGFARKVEKAYKEMFAQWCKEQK